LIEALDHEVFIQFHAGYYYTERKLFIGATHPFVRVRPAIPMRYVSGGWDFGWAVVRTHGHVALRLVDPHTLGFRDVERRCALRWFVRQDARAHRHSSRSWVLARRRARGRPGRAVRDCGGSVS
jgi:hypothetical protein